MINGLRSELFAPNSASLSQPIDNEILDEVDVDGIKILIFTHIRNSLLACKPLADAWHKNISQMSNFTKYRFDE